MSDDVQVLWRTDGYRCVSFEGVQSPQCVVYLFLNDEFIVYTETCRDPEHAALVSEQLWTKYIDVDSVSTE